jgi:hypothetical protein
MYLFVRGYEAMTECGHLFVCKGVPIHDREWSCICSVRGYQAMTESGHVFVC